MPPRYVRTALATAVLAVAGLAMTACSSSTTPAAAGSGAGSATSAPPAASSPVAPSGPAPSTAAPATSGSATTGSASATAPGGVQPCTSAQLGVAQSGGGVGAGQYYSTLVFTNTSGQTCTLAGFPGVSYVAAGGVQSGNPAQRTGDPYGTVTLKPHGTASAALHDSNGIGGYDPAQCQLTAAEGLRIYPPGEKNALFLPWATQHCAGASIHALTIGPLKP